MASPFEETISRTGSQPLTFILSGELTDIVATCRGECSGPSGQDSKRRKTLAMSGSQNGVEEVRHSEGGLMANRIIRLMDPAKLDVP